MTTEIKTTENTQNTQASAMDIIAQLLKENNDLRKGMMEIMANGNGTSNIKKGRAPKSAVHCMDTKTGNVYHSHASAGMAVAPELGLKVHNFVWYEVIAKDKTRFVDISEEKYNAVLKTNAEKAAKAEAEKQAKAATPPAPPTNTNSTNQGKGK